MEKKNDLSAHLKSGVTTICRCWLLMRSDGVSLGFTDHDEVVAFDGFTFEASSGMDASAVQKSSGLSVDNAEAVGALTSDGINELDIASGCYDSADVTQWIVNWQNPEERKLMFRGKIGEITRTQSAFEVELRGQSDVFNKPLGRVYTRQCDCTFGDIRCGVNANQEQYSANISLNKAIDYFRFEVEVPEEFPIGTFLGGTLEFLSGANIGFKHRIRDDVSENNARILVLEEEVAFLPSSDDEVHIVVGCDRSKMTCRDKFDNMVNFQGFPDIPGEDWMFVNPKNALAKQNSILGGS